jgi:hypothetical protein
VHDKIWKGDEMSEYKNCPVCGANDWHGSVTRECGVGWTVVVCRVCNTSIRAANINDRIIQWVPVAERLPKLNKVVFVKIDAEKGQNITVASYVPPRTILASDFLDPDYAEGCEDYDEEKDCYWVLEGWFESTIEAEINCQLSGTVTHWLDDHTFDGKEKS